MLAIFHLLGILRISLHLPSVAWLPACRCLRGAGRYGWLRRHDGPHELRLCTGLEVGFFRVRVPAAVQPGDEACLAPAAVHRSAGVVPSGAARNGPAIAAYESKSLARASMRGQAIFPVYCEYNPNRVVIDYTWRFAPDCIQHPREFL